MSERSHQHQPETAEPTPLQVPAEPPVTHQIPTIRLRGHALPSPPSDGMLPEVPGYEILAELGRGGMGVVYKARQTGLKRLVALKMILAGHFANDEVRARFQMEAEAVARLHHPGIVQIYEVGQHLGQPFFSLEFVEGGSLAERLDGTPWNPRQAAGFVETLAGAMAAAHQQGIVHRDLKPANVLLVEGEGWRVEGKENAGTALSSTLHPPPSTLHPKITDFGLAKRLDIDSARTATGAIMGTPSYMAPEQATGQGHDMGPHTDVYALGVMLYELLSGRVPFRGALPMETLNLALHQEAVPLRRLQPKVPRDLETICQKCLEKESGKRYATAAALADDLHRFLANEPIVARPATTMEIVVKWAKRKPAHAVALTVSTVAAAVLLVGALIFTNELRLERNHARQQEEIARTRENEAELARQEEKQRAQELALALKSAEAAENAEKKRAQELAIALKRTEDAENAEKQRAGELGAALKEVTLAQVKAQGALNQVTNNCILMAENSWNASGSAEIAYHYLDLVPPEFRKWEWHYLKRKYQGSLFTLYGHSSSVGGVAVSGDGSRIVSGSDDKTVRVWDGRTGRTLLVLKGHASAVRTVALSADGSRIASGSQDKTVRIWDARTGQGLLELKHAAGVRKVALNADGSRVVSSAYDQSVRVWDTRTGKALFDLKGHEGWVAGLAFSADGSRIVSGALDATVRVWDAQTGQSLLELKGHADPVFSVAISSDGRRIVSGSGDKTVRLWDVRTGQAVLELAKVHTNAVTGVAFSGDGSRLASASEDGLVCVWDARTGQRLRELHGHTNRVTSTAFSADGCWLVSGSYDQTVRLWDMKAGHGALVLGSHAAAVTDVAMSSDGSRIASAAEDQTLYVWNGSTGQRLLELRGHLGRVTSLAFSADGSRIVSGSENATARVWDARTGEALLVLRDHADEVRGVAISADGSRIVTATANRSVWVWNAKTGQKLIELQGKPRPLRCVAISPNGQRVVGGTFNSMLRIWDAGTGQLLLEFQAHAGTVTSVVYSHDGQRIVTGSSDKTARVCDAETGKLLVQLKGHTGGVESVAVSKDGSRVVTGSTDRTVRVWDAVTGQQLVALFGHAGTVSGVALSGDGSRIASGSGDKTVFLWDARTERHLVLLQGHRSRVTSAAFSLNGSRIVSMDISKVQIIWDAKTGQRLDEAPVPKIAKSGSLSPDGKYLVVGRANDVVLAATHLDEEELQRRLWLTRPDPQWHVQKQGEFEKDGNTYAAALHQSFEQHARGVLAFEAGDAQQALGHFLAAAALKPAPPAPPEIKHAPGKCGPAMPLPFDATLKDMARQDPPHFLTRFDRPPDGPVTLLNIDLSTVSAAGDVFFGIGQPLREVIHFEVQSGAAPTLDRRVFMYNGLAHAQLGVPIHSIVLLLHPHADHPNITGAVRYASRPGRGGTDFSYEIVRLWQQPVEEFLAGPLVTLPLAPLCQLPQPLPEEEALRWVVEQLLERVQQEASPEQARHLLTAAYILTGLRTNPEIARGLFQGVRAMRESSTYQAILEEGRVEGAQRLLLRLGRKRFGEPDEATRQRIVALKNAEQLDQLGERLLDVGSWQELLGQS